MTYDPAKRRSNKRKHKIDLAKRQTHMSKKRTSGNTRKSELSYNPNDRDEVLSFWKEATAHRGVAELRAKLGRPA